MCSFIACKTSTKVLYSSNNLEKLTDIFYRTLLIKGGDETHIVIILDGGFKRKIKITNSAFKAIDQTLQSIEYDIDLIIMGFSRLTPETEDSKTTLSQPYLTDDGRVVAVHGTIPDAENLVKDFDFNINVDTDIFNYLPFQDALKIADVGKISAINIDTKLNIQMKHNGLGAYVVEHDGFEFHTNINLHKHFNYCLREELPSVVQKKDGLVGVALYSGGLDITCSVYAWLNSTKYSNVKMLELIYFDWGTRAREGEIKALYEMKKIVKSQYPGIVVRAQIIEVKSFFKDILKTSDMKSTRLLDNVEGAGNIEAEAAISYVPLRNTFLITLAAARAENLYSDYTTDIIIGANLTEGMVYSDNSENWVLKMDDLIKVSGQKTSQINVVAPFVNHTKTSMLNRCSYSLGSKLKLDHVFSCYFPGGENKDVECGVCGSCILKKLSLERANIELSKDKDESN